MQPLLFGPDTSTGNERKVLTIAGVPSMLFAKLKEVADVVCLCGRFCDPASVKNQTMIIFSDKYFSLDPCGYCIK